MDIEFQCPCGVRQRVSERAAGRQVKCIKCGQTVVVGGVTAAPRTAAPPARRVENAPRRRDRPAPARSGSGALLWVLILIPIGLLALGGVAVVAAGFILFSRATPVASSAPVAMSSPTATNPIVKTPTPPIAAANPPIARPNVPPIAGPNPFVPANPPPNVPAPIGPANNKLAATASSSWASLGPERLIDGNLQTAWFSANNDSAARGKNPWVEIGFPADRELRRVKVMGNRDAAYPIGYSILRGKLTLYDRDRKELRSIDANSVGEAHDFTFEFAPPVRGVRYVRFTSLQDEGDKNGFGDVALSEVQVE